MNKKPRKWKAWAEIVTKNGKSYLNSVKVEKGISGKWCFGSNIEEVDFIKVTISEVK